MLIDHELLFSDQQAVTATANAANVIDLGPLTNNTIRDIGAGEGLNFYMQVDEAALAAGAATVALSLVSDDDPTLSSPTVLWTSGPLPKASLSVGYEFKTGIPSAAYERYLGLVYTVATGPLTAGKFTAGLIKGGQDRRTYGKSYTTV